MAPRIVEFAACLMALGAGLLSVAVPLAPLIGVHVNGPMILVVPFAWGIGLPFLALGLALWPARLLVERFGPRLIARFPVLARLAPAQWFGAMVVASFGVVMISVAFLFEHAPGSPWENFWILVVVGGMFLLASALIASPLRAEGTDALFYVFSGLLVTGFAATVILVAAGRATGGRMEIVEPLLWAVCAVLVALAGATWRNVWREFRSRR